MPPKIPLQPKCYYHIYNRGNNRQLLFREEENYRYFMQLGQKYLRPIVKIYAYALLPNHFHLLIRIKDATELEKVNVKTPREISLKFGHWFNAYAKAYNKRYQQVSSLFEDRFERILIPNEEALFDIFHYIHWSPEKHKVVSDFTFWPYTSYFKILSGANNFLAKKEILNLFDGTDNFIKSHKIGIKNLRGSHDLEGLSNKS